MQVNREADALLDAAMRDNKEDLAASMSHNLEFFSTHPFFVTFVMGIVLFYVRSHDFDGIGSKLI